MCLQQMHTPTGSQCPAEQAGCALASITDVAMLQVQEE